MKMLRLVLLLLVKTVFATPDKLEEVVAWSQVSFQWPNDESRLDAELHGDYVPENNIPLGLEVWKDKLFVTVPRLKNGVPSTLNYVQLPVKSANATLIPYPSWRTNSLPKFGEALDNNTIVSAFRVKADACDRLWMVDTGAVNDFLGHEKTIRNVSIVVYDLRTDALLRRYQLKDSDYIDGSVFANIAVDVNETNCEDAFAYLPDSGTGCGLVVYSWKLNDSWKVYHNYFHFDPLKGNFFVRGYNFQLASCVFGVAFGPADENNYRTAYFHPLSSTTEFSVNTQLLTNKSLALDRRHSFDLFKIEGRTGEDTQSSAEVFDEKTNVLFLTQLQRDGLACWNPRQQLKPENVALVANDKEELIFTNDLKIDQERNIWLFSNRMPLFNYNQLKPGEINYRIFKGKIDDLIKGTNCDA